MCYVICQYTVNLDKYFTYKLIPESFSRISAYFNGVGGNITVTKPTVDVDGDSKVHLVDEQKLVACINRVK